MTVEEFKDKYPDGKKFKVCDTTYTLHYASEVDSYKLRDANGITELYTKEIILDLSNSFNSPDAMDKVELYFERVLRHELIHAFFFELGLRNYCDDEVLVDLLAIKFPAFKKLLSQADNFQ